MSFVVGKMGLEEFILNVETEALSLYSWASLVQCHAPEFEFSKETKN